MAMLIVVTGITVGTLTETGEIRSDDPFLKSFAKRVMELQTIVHGDGVCDVITVRPGDPGYIPVVVDALEEEGYGVVPGSESG